MRDSSQYWFLEKQPDKTEEDNNWLVKIQDTAWELVTEDIAVGIEAEKYWVDGGKQNAEEINWGVEEIVREWVEDI